MVMKPKPDNPLQSIFRPIKLERVAEKVASQLRDAITTGVFRLGDRLPSERELAERMGVSRPSVREAIQQLEIMGLVESIHGGGTLVKSLAEKEIQRPIEMVLGEDIQKVVELTEVRAFMEAWAAKRAAMFRTEAEVERMRAILEEMEVDLEKGIASSAIDMKFHTEIAAAARNTIFLHLMQTIHQLIAYSVRLSRELVFVARPDQETIFNHHLRVFKAIQNRDPEEAEKAMSEHLHFVIREYKHRLLP